MSWAAKRRLVILSIIGIVVIAILALLLVPTFYKAPSCTDGMRNGDEVGVDCGGGCAYVCLEQAQSPTVLYTKAFQYNSGRTDVIASIENKNATLAAKNISYSVTLYGERQALIQQVDGLFDLPPGATEPVYVPGIYSGQQKVVNAFLSVRAQDIKWYTLTSDPRILPKVSNTSLLGTLDAPRIDAVLINTGTRALMDVPVTVVVHGEHGGVVAASKTILADIPAQGSATATFTWNSAFSSAPTKIEVVPSPPLPHR